GATAVRFVDGGTTSFTVVNDSKITATVPAGSMTGKIRVTTPGGDADSTSDFTLTAPAQTLSGTITRDGGTAPCSGILVNAFNAETNTFVKGVFTNGSGGYNLTGLAAGSYHLRFTNTTPSNLSQYYNHKVSISDAAVIDLAAGEAKTQNVDLTLVTPATISGISPASGPVGTVVTITGTNFTPVSTVTFNGTAVTEPTFDSATQIRATVPAGATTGKVRVTTADGVAATSPTNYTVTTAPTQVITGTITNAASPLSGIVVSAFDAGTDTFIKGVYTNGSGVYSITGLSAGTYHLRFTGTTPASLSQYYDHATMVSEATTLTLVAATNLTVNSNLAPVVPPTVSTLTGTISSDAGPMGGVLVSAFNAETNTFVKGVFANASGVYTMNIPAGSYHLRFTATTPSNLSQYYNHQGSIARADVVFVAPGVTTTQDSNLSGAIAR
ncbi:MAG: carboxypeptidase regulatory-like domain-containing protein, partial [Actinomycetes bacterium]